MRAVVFETFGGPVDVRSVADPEPSPGGVVVEVHATGLCRSDWHAWAGHDDGVALPHVPGHELVGVIVAVGADVRKWALGDRVTTPFVCGCGTCEWCRSGQAQVCPDQTQPGFTHWGSFAEYVALHAADTNLVAIGDGVPDAAAAALGCRFATAYRALHARARVAPGEWLTVVGAGGVGLSAVQVGVAAGARVIAVDRTPEALALARRFGAEHTVLADGAGERSGGENSRATSRPWYATLLAAAATWRSTRSGRRAPVPTRSTAFDAAVGTCRWDCSPVSAAIPRCPWIG